MGLGLYNGIYSHDPWTVQWYTHSMGHGLYGGIFALWAVGCTMILYPMAYRLYTEYTYIDTLHLEPFHLCNLGKFTFSYPCPPLPPIHFSYSISSMSWLLIPHLFSPFPPEFFHIFKGPNCQGHSFPMRIRLQGYEHTWL